MHPDVQYMDTEYLSSRKVAAATGMSASTAYSIMKNLFEDKINYSYDAAEKLTISEITDDWY